MPSSRFTTQEFAEWLASGEDWRPSPAQPSYRELLKQLGDKHQHVRAMRDLLHRRLDELIDEAPRDPLYDLELKERGMA